MSPKQPPAAAAADLKALGEAIRGTRKEARMTWSDLAARSGIACSTIQRIERGVENPGFDTMLALAAGLDVEGSASPVASLSKLMERVEWEGGR